MNTLSTAPDTSPIDVAAVRAAVLEAIAQDKISRVKVAGESGIPEGTFGPWLNDKYAGDNVNIARQAQRWLDLRAERLEQAEVMPEAPVWQPTPTSKKMLGILARAQTIGDLVVIGCGAGVGKSATCGQYKATRPNVHLVAMRPSTRGVNTCLVALLNAMGEPNAKGTPQGLADRVIDKVRNANALIIIDEAQHLSVQAVEELRSIHDVTGCGLAFVGDERLFNIFAGSRAGEFAQLTSRMGYRLRQARPDAQDAALLTAAHGITDPKIISVATEIAMKPGALRGLTKVLLIARQHAALTKEPLSERSLRTAWASLDPTQAGSTRTAV
jgi:DNA transposition AAA+ family ATPase